MTTLALDNSLTTVIIIFRVEPPQPGFGKDKPYWEGIAENEDHLYPIVHTLNA